MGWRTAEEAINKPLRLHNFSRVLYVSGVTRDFHFGTLHDAITPIYFQPVKVANLYRYLSFRFNPGNTSVQIAALQRKWQQVFPDAPFDFRFLDDSIARLYETETQMQKAAKAATVVSLMIVLLGVLGIVTMSIAKRSKEMGIRKVLGASGLNILLLFIKEFLGIIVVSNIIAWPLSWYLLNSWLMEYAYRVHIGLLPFLVVGGTLSILVGMIILGMTHRLGAINPVRSLRTE